MFHRKATAQLANLMKFNYIIFGLLGYTNKSLVLTGFSGTKGLKFLIVLQKCRRKIWHQIQSVRPSLKIFMFAVLLPIIF